MKTFINTLSNTYKMVRLLGNPKVGAYLEAQLTTNTSENKEEQKTETLGKNSAFYHKHYIVHVLN